MDDRPRHECCLTADEADLDERPEDFDCWTCPVAEALEGLDDANALAWRIYRTITSRYIADLGIGGGVFLRVTAGLDRETVTRVVGRLSLIYEYLSPAPTPAKG